MTFYKNTLADHKQMLINDNTTYRSSVLTTLVAGDTFKKEDGNELD
jgi:hypothetical protein